MSLLSALKQCVAVVLLSFSLGLILLPSAPAAAQSPLVPPAGGAPAAEPGGLWQQTLGRAYLIQRDLYRRLAAAVRAVKSENSGLATLTLMAVALMYGVFHAVGPGHGKAVISAYLLANESAVRRGILLAFLASFVQGFSAILLVGVLAVMLDMAGIQVRASTGLLESASYALVALVGAWMLISLLRGGGHHHGHGDNHDHGHDHGHGHGESCGHNVAPDPALLSGNGRGTVAKAAGLVIAVGIRPCSGAVLVLLFALAQGVFLSGVAATFAMSFGTAVTVSVLAVLTVYSKRLALMVVGAKAGWVEAAYRGLAFLGAGLLLLLGGALFWGSLGAGGPL